MFYSDIKDLGAVDLPAYTGVRVMMQPFDLADPRGSLPNLPQWHGAVERMIARSTVKGDVGYLTIDEAEVREGETHRRPGAHVDGVGPGGLPGGWGGGGPWGACGMLVAASVRGCRGWRQSFDGEPGPDGDCAHLLEQGRDDARVDMEAGRLYWCGPLAVHESTPMRETGRRQFARVSMPSAAPWFSGYTPSPVGIQPTGPILPRRAGMDYRA
jgi:hypothetical protein